MSSAVTEDKGRSSSNSIVAFRTAVSATVLRWRPRFFGSSMSDLTLVGDIIVVGRSRDFQPPIQFLVDVRVLVPDLRDRVGTQGKPYGRLLGVGQLEDGGGELLRVTRLLVVRPRGEGPHRSNRLGVVLDPVLRAGKRRRTQEVGAEEPRLDDRGVDAQGSQLQRQCLAQPLD